MNKYLFELFFKEPPEVLLFVNYNFLLYFCNFTVVFGHMNMVIITNS